MRFREPLSVATVSDAQFVMPRVVDSQTIIPISTSRIVFENSGKGPKVWVGSMKTPFTMSRMGGLLFGLAVGAVRLLLYWTVEMWLRRWHLSSNTSDLIHSTISFSLFCAIGWYFWRFYTRRIVQRALEDQVRNGLQIVRYLEALESDPGKRAALGTVDVKFEHTLRQRTANRNALKFRQGS